MDPTLSLNWFPSPDLLVLFSPFGNPEVRFQLGADPPVGTKQKLIAQPFQ
jgi:hypothetical protein